MIDRRVRAPPVHSIRQLVRRPSPSTRIAGITNGPIGGQATEPRHQGATRSRHGSDEHEQESTTAAFQQHPDYAIITSFPGLADLSGARVLGEIGNDHTRFTDVRSVKAYAGSAPSHGPSAAASPSPAAPSRTTASTSPDSSGPSPALGEPVSHAATFNAAGHTATCTPPPYDTCSTASSGNSTTDSGPARPTSRSRQSMPTSTPEPGLRLDSWQDRRAISGLAMAPGPVTPPPDRAFDSGTRSCRTRRPQLLDQEPRRTQRGRRLGRVSPGC
ncbi:transposase [Actinosynnema sp. NPDC051121]